jgi:hypothetical protein
MRYLNSHLYFSLALAAGCFCNLSMAMDMTARPCSGWNTARKANLSTVVQREWVYGYLSGLSDARQSQTGKDVFSLLPANEDIVSKLNAHCETHTEDSVNKAARELFDRLVEQR